MEFQTGGNFLSGFLCINCNITTLQQNSEYIYFTTTIFNLEDKYYITSIVKKAHYCGEWVVVCQQPPRQKSVTQFQFPYLVTFITVLGNIVFFLSRGFSILASSLYYYPLSCMKTNKYNGSLLGHHQNRNKK